jgi:hypothetical protein
MTHPPLFIAKDERRRDPKVDVLELLGSTRPQLVPLRSSRLCAQHPKIGIGCSDLSDTLCWGFVKVEPEPLVRTRGDVPHRASRVNRAHSLGVQVWGRDHVDVEDAADVW